MPTRSSNGSARRCKRPRRPCRARRRLRTRTSPAVHIPLAVVYTEAWNFQNRDLETKNETATDFRTNLYNNAQAWDQAEEKSTLTIDTGGGS